MDFDPWALIAICLFFYLVCEFCVVQPLVGFVSKLVKKYKSSPVGNNNHLL